MSVKPSLCTAFIAAAIALAAPLAPGLLRSADAATEIRFSIAGTGGDPNATFTLPEAPTPSSFNAGGSFTFNSEPAVVGGTPVTLTNLAFYNIAGLGGLVDSTYFDLQGAQLYTGTEGSPTFVPGVYSLTGNAGNVDTVTLTALTAVPEPATWAMMLMGFAGLGFAGLRQRNKRSAVA